MDEFGIWLILLTIFGLTIFFVAMRFWILWPSKVKAYHKLRRERVEMGRYFIITCERGHSVEMTDLELCWHLNSLGESMTCPQCGSWVKVSSIVIGREMDYETKNNQLKDYEDWLEEGRGYTYSTEM